MNNIIRMHAAKRIELGDVKADFMEKLFKRFLDIRQLLHSDSVPDTIKLLYIKEAFSIFDEMTQIVDVRAIFADKTMFDDLFEMVNFARNVCLHFPIYETWNQIQISADMANGVRTSATLKGGKIAKYLIAHFGMQDREFSFVENAIKTSTILKYSAIKNNGELTRLSEIISQSEVIKVLFEMLSFMYTAQPDPKI